MRQKYGSVGLSITTLIVTMTILMPSPSYSQDYIQRMVPKPVPPSPNAASLGKFGDYQVSHFTGIPDISIPIYEVKSGELTVPITLSYHASGIKPTDIGSWVGTGWALSAGGQITQNVRGKNDNEFYLRNPLILNPTPCTNYYYMRSVTKFDDTDPDIFSYSYPGGRGKFLLLNNGPSPFGSPPNIKPYLVPFAPIIVNRVHDNRFDITDEKGILYRFGTSITGESSGELTTGYAGGQPSPSASTLNLMQMKSPNSNDSITFKYQNVGTAETYDVSYSFTITDQCDLYGAGACPPLYSVVPQKSIISSRTNQSGLNEILFENGKIKFNMGAFRSDAKELRFLDNIQIISVANGSETVVKTIQFLYSYFIDANGAKARLKLDAVHFIGGSDRQEYKFSYFTNSFSWNPNHVNFWNARDLWGYYNGATSNTNLLLPQWIRYNATPGAPTDSVDVGGGFDRTAKIQYLKEGVLSRIDFPTKGYTEFDYEQNKYHNGSASVDVGGLRVTKIKSTEGGGGLPVIKTYRYGKLQSGYGKPNFTPDQFIYSSTYKYSTVTCEGSLALYYRIRTFHSNSAYSLDGFDSSPVMYPYVTEYNGDVTTGATEGRTEYIFDEGNPEQDFDLQVPNSTKYYRNSRYWKRGKLTSKTIFDNQGNKLAKTKIDYTIYKPKDNKVVGLGISQFEVGYEIVCPAITAGTCVNEQGETVYTNHYFSTQFYQNSGVRLPTLTTEINYLRGDTLKFVATTNALLYDTTNVQVVRASTNSTNNDEFKVTHNTYPYQLSANPSSTGAAEGVYLLNLKHIVSTPIESYTFLQKQNNTNRRVVSGHVTTYKKSPTNSKYVVPDQVYVWESATRVSSYSPIVINGSNNGVTFNSNQKARISSMTYDQYGNIEAVSKTNDVVVSYKWGYKNSLPIAEITNALAKNVFYTSFEEEVSNFSFGGKTGNKSSASAVYNKALSGLEPGDYVLAYYKFVSPTWVYTETPVVVPANGLYTITLPAGQYDEIRFYPKTAQVKTFTYDPIVGIRTETDANGVTTFYDYDSLGRLKLIRDNNNHILKTYEYHYKIMN